MTAHGWKASANYITAIYANVSERDILTLSRIRQSWQPRPNRNIDRQPPKSVFHLLISAHSNKQPNFFGDGIYNPPISLGTVQDGPPYRLGTQKTAFSPASL